MPALCTYCRLPMLCMVESGHGCGADVDHRFTTPSCRFRDFVHVDTSYTSAASTAARHPADSEGPGRLGGTVGDQVRHSTQRLHSSKLPVNQRHAVDDRLAKHAQVVRYCHANIFCTTITSLPKVIWEEGRVATLSHTYMP